jgi:hypothetical protein
MSYAECCLLLGAGEGPGGLFESMNGWAVCVEGSQDCWICHRILHFSHCHAVLIHAPCYCAQSQTKLLGHNGRKLKKFHEFAFILLVLLQLLQ